MDEKVERMTDEQREEEKEKVRSYIEQMKKQAREHNEKYERGEVTCYYDDFPE